jgi:hypothetical protein
VEIMAAEKTTIMLVALLDLPDLHLSATAILLGVPMELFMAPQID